MRSAICYRWLYLQLPNGGWWKMLLPISLN